MLKTSPAFSFTGKYHLKNQEVKPSPSTYFTETWNPKKLHLGSNLFDLNRIGTDKKCKIDINNTPGPGQYQSTQAERSNKFGIFGKQNGRVKTNTQKSPSPCQYSSTIKDQGLSISFAKKFKIVDKDINNPGPGFYERTIHSKTQGSVIGKEKRFVEEKQLKLVPGPGTYQSKGQSAVKVSFGREMRQCGKKIHTSVDPGPGQYDQITLFESSKNSSKGFSLGYKTLMKDLETKPGPANYDPDYTKVYYNNPSFSMPRRYKPMKPNQSPGPNEYHLKSSNQSLHVSFYKAQRKTFINTKQVPGPGQYKPEKIFKSSPKFSLGLSRKNDIKQDFPGPGTYMADKSIIKLRPQSAKIGKGKRYDDRRQLSPGPGQYQSIPRSRPTTPSYGFGKDSRMKHRIITSPGPGQYLVPSTVGHKQYRKYK